MKRQNKYFFIMTIGFILWFTETAYFGWNGKPSCPLESMADTVAWFLIMWGCIGDLISDVTIIKR